MADKLMGEDAALKNLNNALRGIMGATVAGLYAGAMIVKEGSMEETPVDTSNLKNSHYLSRGEIAGQPVVEVGTTAEYSVYVHENLESYHKIGKAKFLEDSIKKNSGRVIDEVAKRAKIK